MDQLTGQLFKEEFKQFMIDFIEQHELEVNNISVRVYHSPDGFTAIAQSE